MEAARPLPRLIVAEDDQEDLMILLRVLEKHNLLTRISVVGDGSELVDYLTTHSRRKGSSARIPTVVLLDLKMPTMDGNEALRRIKQSNDLRHVPIVIFTTTRSDEDVDRCYHEGANAFVEKPRHVEGYDDVIATIRGFWLQTARLPYL